MDLKLEKKVTDEIGKLSKWLNLEHCNHNPYYTNLVTVNFIDNFNGLSIKKTLREVDFSYNFTGT